MSRVLFSIGVVQVLIMLVGLGRMKALSLLLGPEGVGLVGTLDQAIVLLAQASAFGLPFTAMKFMARAHSDGAAPYRESYAGFLRLLLTTSVLVTFFVAIALWLAPALLPAGLAGHRSATMFALLGAPVFVLTLFFIQVVASAGRAGEAARLTFVLALSLALAAVAGAWWRGVTGLYVASMIAGATGMIAVVAWLARAHGLRPEAGAGSAIAQLRRSPEIIPYALMAHATLVTYGATMFAVRYFALAALGPVQAGQLQAQLSVALTVGAVLTPLNNLYLTPLLNRNTPSAGKVAAAEQFARMAVLLFVLGALPIVLFPSLVLHVLYSRAFISSALALVAFVLWQLLFQVGSVLQQLLLGLDDIAYCTSSSVAGYLVTIALCVPLTRRFGLLGVAIALACGTLVYAAAYTARLASRHHYRISRTLIFRVTVSMVLLAAAGTTHNVWVETSFEGVALRIVVALAVMASVYGLLDGGERTRLLALLPGGAARGTTHGLTR